MYTPKYAVTQDIVTNTLVDYPRLDVIAETLEALDKNGVHGAVAEVGVYKGGTAKLLVTRAPHRHVYLFDTFEGMPPVIKDKDLHNEGDFKDTSLQHVSGLLKPAVNFSLYKGIFPQQNSEYAAHEKFAFVHLDVDIYSSVKNGLEFFSSRMVPGGVILLDDYNEPHCPGAKLATDEFVAVNGFALELTVQSQARIRFK